MASIESLTRADGSPSYKVRWYANGRRGVRTFRDHADAIAYKALLERNELNQERTERLYAEARDTGPTLAEVMHAHVKQLTNVGPGQLARYTKSIPAHFADIGGIRVANLTQADIKQWVQRMERDGYKPKTISNHKGFLAAALNTAVSNQVIGHNVTKGVKVGAGTDYEDKVHYLTGAQWAAILENIPEHYKSFFEFLLISGVRFGEATALTPADFDLEPMSEPDDPFGVVYIRKAWKEDGKGGHYLGPPKTKKGRRDVSIPAPTIARMAGLLAKPKDELVFTNTLGTRIQSSAAHKVWGPACAKAGIEVKDRPRLHDLRHTSAAIHLRQGLDMYKLSRRLGHANIQMSIDRYSDLMPDARYTSAAVSTKALESF